MLRGREAVLNPCLQNSLFSRNATEEDAAAYLKELPWQDEFETDPARCLIREEDPRIDLIQGDNLDALEKLKPSILGKVDVIYIDPPYNTGALHFAYDDKFGPNGDASHAEWVSFMRARLSLARDVLAEDGVIFIAIDDNEQARLRLLCDELFGEGNFVCQFIWHKTRKGKALSRVARQVTEYVLCFAKSKKLLGKDGLFGSEPGADVANPFHHRPNKPRLIKFPPGTIRTSMEDGDYQPGIYGDINDSLSAEVKKAFTIKDGLISTELEVFGRFRWTQKNLDAELFNGDVEFHIRRGKFRIIFYKSNGHKAPSSLLDDRCGVGTYEEASKELEAILGGQSFIYPKPTSLIKYLVKAVTIKRPYALVLDFFAGSGVTGHAVAQLNSEIGGFRSCILITDNSGKINGRFVEEAGDQGICSSITSVRLKRALTGSWASGQVDGLPGSLVHRKIALRNADFSDECLGESLAA
jgi:adenine-specific DNA-methyltransferase